jgi:hypothetical protein
VLFLSNADASAVAPSSPMPFPDACVATHVTKHNLCAKSHRDIIHSTTLGTHSTQPSITATLTADIQTLQHAVPLQRRCKRRRALVTNAVP